MKTCSRCGTEKPQSDFSPHKGMRDGLQPWCKPCKAESLREWRAANPGKNAEYCRQHYVKNRERRRARANASYAADPDSARTYLARKLRRKFRISLEEYDAIVSQPCGLCGASKDIVLDHDHLTNKIRGPLCQVCNKAIGMLGDDPARLRAAADYIEQHR